MQISSCTLRWMFESLSLESKFISKRFLHQSSKSLSNNPHHSTSRRKQFKAIPIPRKLEEEIRNSGLSQDSLTSSPSIRKNMLVKDGPESGAKVSFVVPQEKHVMRIPSRLSFVQSARDSTEFINSNKDVHISPEVAFVGRSNVGKSALINALAQSTICKTSSFPGVTRTINWYKMEKIVVKTKADMDGIAYLVDMPGYGYAHTTQATRDHWKELLDQYFTSRSEQGQLKQLYVILDARHGLKSTDVEWLEAFNPFKSSHKIKIQLVMTKCDLVSAENLARMVVKLQDDVKARVGISKMVASSPILVSSLTRAGIAKLRENMFKHLGAIKRVVNQATRDLNVTRLPLMQQRHLKQHEIKVRRIEEKRNTSRRVWKKNALNLKSAIVSIAGSVRPLTQRKKYLRHVKALQNERMSRNIERSKREKAARKPRQ